MTYPTTRRGPEFGTLILDLARHGVALPTAAQQLAFFETVLNRLPLEVAVLDTEGRYLYLNPDAVKNPEVRSWMIGKNDLEYCQHRGYDLEIAHTRRRYIETACREQQRVSFEEMFETPSGRKYHWRNYQPVCSASGELHFVLGFGRDITETRQVEAQLALSQKRVHGILENLTDAFFSLDHERRFTYLNTKAQQIFVHETDALLGRNLGEVFPRKEGEPPTTTGLEHSRAPNPTSSSSFTARAGTRFTPIRPTKVWQSISTTFPSAEPFRQRCNVRTMSSRNGSSSVLPNSSRPSSDSRPSTSV